VGAKPAPGSRWPGKHRRAGRPKTSSFISETLCNFAVRNLQPGVNRVSALTRGVLVGAAVAEDGDPLGQPLAQQAAGRPGALLARLAGGDGAVVGGGQLAGVV